MNAPHPRWSPERRAEQQQARRADRLEDTTGRLLGRIALRLLLALAFTGVLWVVLGLGVFGLVFASPLYGVLLGRPVIELVSSLRRTVKAAALAPLEGRYYEHRGVPIDIAEDEHHERWLHVGHVRKLLPGLPRDALLMHRFAESCRIEGPGRILRIKATTLLQELAKAQDPQALKFKVWLEREVVLPAQTLRERRHRAAAPAPTPAPMPAPIPAPASATAPSPPAGPPAPPPAPVR